MAGRKRTENGGESIRSIERACEILFFLADKTDQDLNEIAKATLLPKTTAFRILSTLEKNGLVKQDEVTKRYSLGARLINLGTSAIHQVDIRSIAIPHMRRLSDLTGSSITLNILQDGHRVCIERIEKDGPYKFRYYLPIGARVPLYIGAGGKTIMSCLPEPEVDYIIKTQILNTEGTVNIDLDKLKRELELIREQGYAITKDEMGLNVVSFAAPIVSHIHKTYASLNISLPLIKYDPKMDQEFSRLVLEATREISRSMGEPV